MYPCVLRVYMNCYAENVAARFSNPGQPYEGLAKLVTIDKGKPTEHTDARWTGKLMFVEKHLQDPIRWQKPRRIFVNSMSDLFHDGVEEEWLNRIYAVMAFARKHTFQILTKRPKRMLEELRRLSRSIEPIERAARDMGFTFKWQPPLETKEYSLLPWPIPNIWHGVSVEDQETADERIPILMETPSAVRWISYEPALGPVTFQRWLTVTRQRPHMLDWIVYGGESGIGFRPDDPSWARGTRCECKNAGVSFYYKQSSGLRPGTGLLDGAVHHEYPHASQL